MTELLDLLSDGLGLLHALGAWSASALWLPVLAWTLATLVALALLRWRAPHPLVGYRARQALLFALLPGLALAAATDWSLPLLPAAPAPAVVDVGALAPVAPVPLATAAPPPALPGLAWPHALGALTLVAGLLAAWRLARLAVSAARVFFYRRRARSAPVPASVQAAAREAAGHLQVRRPFRLACGPEDAVPMTLGPFRPVVVIPPGLRGESLTMALAHELVHLRRRDDVAAWGEALVAALFFVHPLCALLRRRIAAAREAACDAAVLEGRRFSPRRYAQMLLDLAAPARPGARPPLALSLAAPARSLPSRLRAMKDRPTAAPRFALLSSALLLALPLLLMACADLSAPAEHATPPPPPSQTEMDRLVQQSVASIEVRKDSTRPGTPEIRIQFGPGTPEDVKQRIRRHIELRDVTDARITFGEAAENSAENRVEAFRSPRDRTSGEGRRIEIPPPSLNEELADAIASLSMYKPEGGPFQLRITLEDGTPESTREALREHLQEQLRDSELEVVFKAPPPPTPPTPDDMLPGPQASAPPAPRPAAADTVVPFAVVEEKPRYAGAGPQGEVKYPEEAVQNEIEGTVHLQFVVTPEGGVRDVEVLRSPAEVLSEEAVRALRATDFEPGYREDRAVAVRMSIPVRFALSGPSRAERSR